MRLTHKFLSLFFFCLGIALSLGFSQLNAQEPKVIYIYDDLGRLSRVVDQNNECATYEYDAVGNILSITRSTNCLQPPTIDSLSQDTANAGDTTCITIAGTNFLGATVTTDNPDVQVSRVRVTETSIEVCLNISPFASVGTTRVFVSTTAGTVVGTFTINPRAIAITQNTSIGPTDLKFEGAALTIEGQIIVTIDGTHRFASLTLRNNALVTHSPATASSTSRVDLMIDGLLIIDPASRVDVTGRGFLGARQPGNPFTFKGDRGMTVGFQAGSTPSSGGSYGGLGGVLDGSPNPIYGDFTNPNDVGSGGAGGTGPAGNGGGLIRIVAGTLQLDGLVTANGGDAQANTESGGGSGGGIRIDVGTLRGAGAISANGGKGGTNFSGGPGGGGGRVAVYYQTIAGFDLTKITAFGGTRFGSATNGGAGTVYLQGSGRESGELVVDNNNVIAPSLSTPLAPQPLGDLRIRHGAKARVDAVFNLTGTVEISSSSELALTTQRLSASTINVTDSSLITHLPTTASAFFEVDLSANAITVDATSRIDVTGRGFLGARQPGNPFTFKGDTGMTVGFQAGSTGESGGSYGGLGGSIDGSSNPIYGDFSNPNDVGSGGAGGTGPAGNGGGLIRIVAATLQLDGPITANGADAQSNTASGGGSGGGIRIDVGALRGTGTISANGGRGGPQFSGGAGGGGGRVAVYYQDAVGFDLAKITASGGTGFGSAPAGQNGSVFTQQQIFQ
ncbi:MAG: RHS repeat protein [Deltaproteobacteria bacterium]|nr:RHS repeat protein [Deltaproteobacteria bacterium]